MWSLFGLVVDLLGLDVELFGFGGGFVGFGCVVVWVWWWICWVCLVCLFPRCNQERVVGKESLQKASRLPEGG